MGSESRSGSMWLMGERTIVVGRRFRGPDMAGETGNGGYFCGLVGVAAGPETRAVEIRRTTGVPLDQPLTVRVVAECAEVHDDEGLIARTSAAEIAVVVPAPPALEGPGGLRSSFWIGSRAGRSGIRFRNVLCVAIGGLRAMGCVCSRDRSKLISATRPGCGWARGRRTGHFSMRSGGCGRSSCGRRWIAPGGGRSRGRPIPGRCRWRFWSRWMGGRS